jgi:hypothetical protein
MEKEKSMRALAVALVGVLLLAGCSTPVRQIEISAKPIEKPNLILPPAQELRLKDLEWVIITQENAQEVFEQLLKDRKDPVLIGLTDDGYEILSLNYSDIMAYIQQQNAIIKAYRNYYEESEQALQDANKQIENAQVEIEAQNSAPQESTLDKLNPFK